MRAIVSVQGKHFYQGFQRRLSLASFGQRNGFVDSFDDQMNAL
jgi:hypothetical protein